MPAGFGPVRPAPCHAAARGRAGPGTRGGHRVAARGASPAARAAVAGGLAGTTSDTGHRRTNRSIRVETEELTVTDSTAPTPAANTRGVFVIMDSRCRLWEAESDTRSAGTVGRQGRRPV